MPDAERAEKHKAAIIISIGGGEDIKSVIAVKNKRVGEKSGDKRVTVARFSNRCKRRSNDNKWQRDP